MSYTIVSYDGNFTVAADTLDTSNSALLLPGKEWSGWGELYENNFMRLLENSAGTTAPPGLARTGQLWYNPSTKSLQLYDNTSGWAAVNSGLSAPITINATGDATGTVSFQNGGETDTLALTLATTGITPGTYSKITFDAKGRATFGTNLTSSDIIGILGFTPGTGAGSVASVNIGSSTLVTSGGPVTTSGTLNVDLAPYGTPGTYEKVNVDSYGRVSSGSNLTSGDIAAALGFAPISAISSTTLAASGNTVDLAAYGTAGLYQKVNVDVYGRVSSGGNLSFADIIAALGYTPLSTTSFTQSFNNPGWIKLPNGFIFQWGHGNGGVRTIWPITFPNFCLFPMAGPPGPSSGTDNVYSAQFASYDASGGTAYAAATTGVSMRVNTNYSYPYFVLGY